MSHKIPNFGAALPAKYKGETHKDIDELNIKSLFRMVILGPSYSGKNNFVFYMLKNSPNVFSHLHIIARNPDQELYSYLKDKLNGFITFHDAGQMPRVDEIRKTREGIELVVFDDLSNDEKLQQSVISHYYTRGRHFKLSTIFLSHAWFRGTAKIIRQNTEYVAILRANSKRDLLMILKDFNIPVSEEGFYTAYRRATSEKAQALFIDSINSEIRYNFKQKIELSSLN